MTTPTAAAAYLAMHQFSNAGKKPVVFNPEDKPVAALPVIYGFNNGGASGWLEAILLAEDGTFLGSHICSDEGYMPHDLGVLEGTRPDRHVHFQAHYPGGYRMEFVCYKDAQRHKGLNAAILRSRALHDSKK